MELKIVVLQVCVTQVALSGSFRQRWCWGNGKDFTYLRVYVDYHIIAPVGHCQYWGWIMSLWKWMLKLVCKAFGGSLPF